MFFLIATRIVASRLIHLYDDAFITFRYSRNLAEGIGFVYNPGEWVLGTTTPGFGLLLSLFYWLHIPMPTAAVAFSVLCDVATLLLTWRFVAITASTNGGLSDAAENRSAIERGLFAFLFITIPILNRTGIGGMESSSYLLLSLVAILLFCREREMIAIAIAALSYSFRPEGVILLGLLIGVLLLRRGIGHALKGVGIAAAILAPYFLLLYLSYGHILSQSVLAKSTLVRRDSILTTLSNLLTPELVTALLLVPALLGMAVTFAAHRRSLRDALMRPRVIIALWCLLYIAAYAVARPMIFSWYGQPIYYAFALFAAIATADLMVRLKGLRRSTHLSTALLWSPILGLVIWIGLALVRGESVVVEHVYEGIKKQSATIGPADTIAAYDIGALGYYTNAYIYDLAGLVTPDALRYPEPDTLLKALRPDYFFVFATKREVTRMMNDPVLRRLYSPIALFLKSGEGLEALDTSTLSPVWSQEYVLYRRVEEE